MNANHAGEAIHAALNNNLGSGGYFYIFFYLIVVVVVIALLFWVRRYAMRRMGPVKNGRYMRVIDRISVAQDKQIVMLELQDKIAIVGITGQSINLLLELPRDAVTELPPPETSGDDTPGFSQLLGDAMKDKLPFAKGRNKDKEETDE